MPTYRYKCETCGEFDFVQRMSESNLTDCPTCQKNVKKLFTAPVIAGRKPAPYGAAPTTRSDRSSLWNSAQAE